MQWGSIKFLLFLWSKKDFRKLINYFTHLVLALKIQNISYSNILPLNLKFAISKRPCIISVIGDTKWFENFLSNYTITKWLTWLSLLRKVKEWNINNWNHTREHLKNYKRLTGITEQVAIEGATITQEEQSPTIKLQKWQLHIVVA